MSTSVKNIKIVRSPWGYTFKVCFTASHRGLYNTEADVPVAAAAKLEPSFGI